ncbi:MAG TPA: hypothetical protein PKM41_13890 [Deltaproteobacteria bacterium]|jgi:hypothetical protein|nr:hypothetical protein [Deltaproteobacteria bacterium]HOI08490.1 hypothetical protein [Deltaproteobacteria bacterium]
MKKQAPFRSVTVVSIGGSIPSHAEARFSDPEGEKVRAIDAVVLDLDEDNPARDLNLGEVKYVA